ncbi:thioredoxin [Nocardia sp. NPDC088792]|uniref:thioredoxin n=1 Tax=Nocardia sp. NPDC088792 TaxID=3364332 RepID=UPI0037F4D48E
MTISKETYSGIVVVTEETFQREVLEAVGPVLVDFTADWCPPCRMVAPVLADIARERTGTLIICKIDTDANPSVTRDYHIMSMPTMLLFRDGLPIHTIVGARPKARILAELDAALSE